MEAITKKTCFAAACVLKRVPLKYIKWINVSQKECVDFSWLLKDNLIMFLKIHELLEFKRRTFWFVAFRMSSVFVFKCWTSYILINNPKNTTGFIESHLLTEVKVMIFLVSSGPWSPHHRVNLRQNQDTKETDIEFFCLSLSIEFFFQLLFTCSFIDCLSWVLYGKVYSCLLILLLILFRKLMSLQATQGKCSSYKYFHIKAHITAKYIV